MKLYFYIQNYAYVNSLLRDFLIHIPSENVTSYSDFSHKDYWQAIEWLKPQGLNANNSRYVAIMRDLGEYPAELIWGMSEVDTLYRVYLDILINKYIDGKVLRKLLNGLKFSRMRS